MGKWSGQEKKLKIKIQRGRWEQELSPEMSTAEYVGEV